MKRLGRDLVRQKGLHDFARASARRGIRLSAYAKSAMTTKVNYVEPTFTLSCPE